MFVQIDNYHIYIYIVHIYISNTYANTHIHIYIIYIYIYKSVCQYSSKYIDISLFMSVNTCQC